VYDHAKPSSALHRSNIFGTVATSGAFTCTIKLDNTLALLGHKSEGAELRLRFYEPVTLLRIPYFEAAGLLVAPKMPWLLEE
jgi:hypothetical protein